MAPLLAVESTMIASPTVSDGALRPTASSATSSQRRACCLKSPPEPAVARPREPVSIGSAPLSALSNPCRPGRKARTVIIGLPEGTEPPSVLSGTSRRLLAPLALGCLPSTRSSSASGNEKACCPKLSSRTGGPASSEEPINEGDPDALHPRTCDSPVLKAPKKRWGGARPSASGASHQTEQPVGAQRLRSSLPDLRVSVIALTVCRVSYPFRYQLLDGAQRGGSILPHRTCSQARRVPVFAELR